MSSSEALAGQRPPLKLLRELFPEEEAVGGEVRRQVRVDAEAEDVLAFFARAQSVAVVAVQDGWVLRFPVSISSQDGQHAFHLGWPRITDRRGADRSVRVTPAEGDLHLVDASGVLTDPTVMDISSSGLLIHEPSVPALDVDDHLGAMLLRLPEGRVLQLKGRVVRVDRVGPSVQIAVAFTADLDSSILQALEAYIFQRFGARTPISVAV